MFLVIILSWIIMGNISEIICEPGKEVATSTTEMSKLLTTMIPDGNQVSNATTLLLPNTNTDTITTRRMALTNLTEISSNLELIPTKLQYTTASTVYQQMNTTSAVGQSPLSSSEFGLFHLNNSKSPSSEPDTTRSKPDSITTRIYEKSTASPMPLPGLVSVKTPQPNNSISNTGRVIPKFIWLPPRIVTTTERHPKHKPGPEVFDDNDRMNPVDKNRAKLVVLIGAIGVSIIVMACALKMLCHRNFGNRVLRNGERQLDTSLHLHLQVNNVSHTDSNNIFHSPPPPYMSLSTARHSSHQLPNSLSDPPSYHEQDPLGVRNEETQRSGTPSAQEECENATTPANNDLDIGEQADHSCFSDKSNMSRGKNISPWLRYCLTKDVIGSNFHNSPRSDTPTRRKYLPKHNRNNMTPTQAVAVQLRNETD